MWWLLVPVGLGIAKGVYDVATGDKTPPQKKSIFELNLERLKQELNSHSGRKIAIIGQPGAGKSSLLKKMTNSKVRPLPIIGTETDATSWADDVKCNLLSHYKTHIFVDVPGYDTATHPAHIFVSSFPFHQFDAFIFVTHGKLHSSDEHIFRLINQSGKRLYIARSFAESLENDERISVQNDMRKRLAFHSSVPVLHFSNRTGEGIEAVFKQIACL